jgi:hypothetical protein
VNINQVKKINHDLQARGIYAGNLFLSAEASGAIGKAPAPNLPGSRAHDALVRRAERWTQAFSG